MFSLARGRNTRVSEQITWKEGSLDQEEQGLGGRGEMWPLLGWLEFHGPGMVGVWEVGVILAGRPLVRVRTRMRILTPAGCPAL